LAACAPKIVKETVVVEKQVEKVVEKTVVVTEKQVVEVEKEVTRVVEKVAQPAGDGAVVVRLNFRAGGENSEWPMYVARPREFMEENPGIKIELAPIPGGEYAAKIMTMAAADTIGDVMWTTDVYTEHSRYVKLGILATVDDHLDKYGKSKDEWLPACVDTLTHDGKMYGLPKCSHPGDSYLWVNIDMLEEAGIPEPEVYGNTHQDIAEWAMKVAKGPENDREVYGYIDQSGHIMGIFNPVRSFGQVENVEDGSESLANTEEWVECVKWTKSFYDNKLVALASALPTGGVEALFASGRLGILHRQRSTYKRIREATERLNNPFRWKTIQFPKIDNARGWVACVDTHSPTANSKVPDEAFQWAYAMADARFTELVAKNIGYLGGRRDDIDTISGFMYPFLELQYKNGLEEEKFYQPPNARGMEAQTVLVNGLQQLFLNEAEVTQAFMDGLKKSVDEVLAKPF
jgi:ABC-type glycerol-3-phosphate transport system substrate-binding protein